MSGDRAEAGVGERPRVFGSGVAQRVSDLWAPLPTDSAAWREGLADGSICELSSRSVRWIAPGDGASGSADFFRLGDSCHVSVANIVLPGPLRQTYDTDEAMIVLRASLSCDVSYSVDGAAPMIFNRPEVTLAYVPRGLPLTIDTMGGRRQQGLLAFFRADDFARRHELRDEAVPALLREALRDGAGSGRIASFPIDATIARLVAETIDSRLGGELQVLQAAARTAELVAHTLDAMQRTPALRGAPLLSSRSVALAHAARERLEREYRAPPLFTELAHDIGTNQSKLKKVFRALFGSTMAQYCLDRRMREAQQLLLDDTLSIAQVAEHVGYEHQSSFAIAFREHVGLSPSDYRKHRAPFSLPLGREQQSVAG